MPASPDRALTFDDLLPPGGSDAIQYGGIGTGRNADGSLRLDPRYEAWLAATSAGMRPPATPRERFDGDAVFSAGTAPFGFAGPGMPSFDERSDAASRDLNRFRVEPHPEGPRRMEEWLPDSSMSQFGGVGIGRAPDGSIRIDPRYEAELTAGRMPAAKPSPAEVNRSSLAYALRQGYTHNDDEIARVASFRGHQGWKPATADDVMWSKLTGGLLDKGYAALRAVGDTFMHGDSPSAAYRDELAAQRDWLDQLNRQPTSAGSMDAARDELKRRFTTASNDFRGINKVRAFRERILPDEYYAPAALALDQFSLGASSPLKAAGLAAYEASRGGDAEDAFDRSLDADQDIMDRYKIEHPIRALAAEGAGLGVLAYLNPEAALFGLAGPKSMKDAIIQGAFRGGLRGGVSGAFRTRGGIYDRAIGMASGAGDGAYNGMKNAPFGYVFGNHVWPPVKKILGNRWSTLVSGL